jgi:hypothetical protein
MLRHGITLLKKWFRNNSTTLSHNERKTIMTPELTQEYLEILQKEYQYVSTCLNYSNNKFKLLVNGGINPNILQEVNNQFSVRKASLEMQIYTIRDFLKE